MWRGVTGVTFGALFAELRRGDQCCGGGERVGHPRETETPERDGRGAPVPTRDAERGGGSVSGERLQPQEAGGACWLIPSVPFLLQESGVVIDMSMKQPFLELNRILEALRMQDLGPALE